MYLTSHLMVQENPYSLYAKGDFQYLRQTRKLSVNYYVKKDFQQTYNKQNEIRRLEGMVEDEYIEFLRGSCYSERMNKENLRRKGIYFSKPDLIKKAESYATPSCEKLDKLFSNV